MGKKEKILVSTDKSKQRNQIKKVVNDPLRLQAVKNTQLLDTPAEASFDRLTKLASKLLKTPVSFVTLLEKNRDFVKSHYGLPEPITTEREIRAHPSFCQHIISHTEPLILEDARENPLFSDFPSVQGMGVVAYAGIPLITPEGYALGTCCVVDFKPRKWTKDEIEILTELAKSVMTEINLRTVAAQLKKEVKYKDEFIGVASHELKTPLTSLKAYTQILQKKATSEGNTELLNGLTKMDRQLTKLNTLVGDLLDVTKIERGKLSLQQESFNLSDLAYEIIEDMQKTSEKHTIIFNQVQDTFVNADRERVGQVLTNFISNAIKYSPNADKVIVSITNRNNKMQLSVQDFGLGISADKLKRVFERFYRIGGARENTFPGLGLGLYISSEIVRQHAGEIWAESTLGRGSTFFFNLPQSSSN